MTELAPTLPAASASTELNPSNTTQNPSGYKPDEAPEKREPAKPLSAREALAKAAEETKFNDAKAEKPVEKKPEPKPAQKEPEQKLSEETEKADRVRAEDGKFQSNKTPEPSGDEPEVAGKVAEEGGAETRSSEGRDTKSPPPGFLPRAREKWGSVDPDVQSEMYRALDNFEKGKAEYQEDREFRKSIKPYEDMAKQFGTSVPNYLENTLRINQHLSQDLVGGLDVIAKQYGYSIQQIAQHVLQQAQNQPQFAPEVSQMQQQINQLTQTIQQLTQGNVQDREAARHAEIMRTVIEPFKASHPRYAELEPDIAFFLNSGKIPSTMSERQRLEHAYDMAERINPGAYQTTPERLEPAPQTRPLNPAGKPKSIKGPPSSADLNGRDKGKLSPRDAIRAAAAEHGINM